MTFFFFKKKHLLVLKEITTIKYETAPSMPAIHTSLSSLGQKSVVLEECSVQSGKVSAIY